MSLPMNSETQNQKSLPDSSKKSLQPKKPLTERQESRLLACCRMVQMQRRMEAAKEAVEALK
jgi:hypothetical protein